MLERIVVWAHRRRGRVFLASAFLVAASLSGIRLLDFDADVLSLLPSGGRAIPAFRTYLSAFGTLDDLYVVFTAPEGHDASEYTDEIDGWVDALDQAPEISWVESGAPDPSRDWSWLADRQLLLLDGRRLDEALSRFTPAGMPAALASARALLAIPSPEIAALVRQDPLGLFELLRGQLGAGQTGLNVGVNPDGWISADGRRRLVIARPLHPPFDTSFAHAVMDRVEAIAARSPGHEADADLPPLGVQIAGGHRIAIEVEDVVRRESIINGVVSLALILPLLLIVFRSPRLVAVGALPTAVSLLVVLGLLGLVGVTLSAAATGAAAMLFGLGVDGVVLLFVAYRLSIAEGADAESAVRSLGGPSTSMLLGMWTTAATFLGLMAVDFPSLEQLGLLIGGSMIVCGLLTLVLVPASLPRTRPGRAVPPLVLPGYAAAVARFRLPILCASAVITILLGWSAFGLRVNPTLERLRAVTPGARLQESIARDFQLPSDVHVVLAEGRDLEALLAGNEALVQRLKSEDGPAVQAPSMLVPSQATQARRAAKIRAALPNPDALGDSLADAARAAGFRQGSFDAFEARLPRLAEARNVLTVDGYAEHGLDRLLSRLVARKGDDWVLATYVFAKTPAELAALSSAVEGTSMVVTGMAPVNHELAVRFLPQFLRGLALGTAVVIGLVLVTFRSARRALLALAPTALGLIWAAGTLALAGIELDLFAVFAVVTFVGIGVDYGIHLVYRTVERGDAAKATAEMTPTILAAGTITLLGYGTLVWSSYPPLESMGIVSVVSVIALVAASTIVLPALLIEGPK